MKRNLFQNITAIPYASGDAIDRTGFLSAVLGFNAASAASVTVKVEHSDDGTTFVPVTDERVFPETQTKGGEYKFTAPTIPAPATKAGETTPTTPTGLVNVDVDLVGLKSIVKFTVTGATGSVAVVLGDSAVQPA